MSSIQEHGADDISTTIRFTATCRYCGRLLECLNAETLLYNKDIRDRKAPRGLERRMDWAHRLGVGDYKLDCEPEHFLGEYNGYPYGREAAPRLNDDNTVCAKWTIIVSVNGVDRFGVHTDGLASAKRMLPKILIWNPRG